MTNIPNGGVHITRRPALHPTNTAGRTQRESGFVKYEVYKKLGGSLSRERFQKVVEQQISFEAMGGILELLNAEDIQTDNLTVFDLKAITKLWVSRECQRDIPEIMKEAAFLQGRRDLLERTEEFSPFEILDNPKLTGMFDEFKKGVRGRLQKRKDKFNALVTENAALSRRVAELNAELLGIRRSLRITVRKGQQLAEEAAGIRLKRG